MDTENNLCPKTKPLENSLGTNCEHIEVKGKPKEHLKENNKEKYFENYDEIFQKSQIKDLLRQCPEGNELNLLCRIFQPDPENLECVYERIHHDIYEALSKRRKWTILPFGSTVTGMAFKNSDMDFYVSLDDSTLSNTQIFVIVEHELKKSSKFSNIVPIRNARVPIIKCNHCLTGYNVDINMSSVLGVHNSKYIAKLFASDPRIHPIMLLVKIWGKNNDMIKTGYMTSYCLALLLLFYLQNLKPPILLPIKRYQTGVEEYLVEGVNFAFNCSVSPLNINKDNIKIIAMGFFEFYKNFDYNKYIISPFLGIAINRQDLKSKRFHFPEYVQSMNNTKEKANFDFPLYVQDAFSLHEIKSASVKKHLLEIWKIKTEKAYRTFSESIKNKISSAQTLIQLFYGDSDRPGPSNLSPIKAIDMPMSYDLNPLETELVFVRSYLRKSFPTKFFSTTEINKFWTEKVFEYTPEILKTVFNLQLKTINSKPTEKEARINDQKDFHCNDKIKLWEIKATMDVWSKRKFDFRNNCSQFLQDQIAMTKARLENANIPSSNILAIFSLVSNDDYNFISLSVNNLIPTGGGRALKNFLLHFFAQLRLFLKCYFEKLIQ